MLFRRESALFCSARRLNERGGLDLRVAEVLAG